MASLSAVTAQLEAPASALVGAVRWLLDGPLAAPLDAAEEAWRAVLPEQPVKVLDQFLAENGSAHAKSLPLMNPYDVATIITGYLAVVALGLLIKPPKIEPKLFVAAHNLFLAVLSLYMMTEILHQGRSPATGFSNGPPHGPNASAHARGGAASVTVVRDAPARQRTLGATRSGATRTTTAPRAGRYALARRRPTTARCRHCCCAPDRHVRLAAAGLCHPCPLCALLPDGANHLGLFRVQDR